MSTSIISGSISGVPAAALVTCVDSSTHHPGEIDNVIKRAAGNRFHNQLAGTPVVHGQTVVAEGDGTHEGAFENVIFVWDTLSGPLAPIVTAGLNAAADKGFKTVSMPVMRTGDMNGRFEKTTAEVVAQMAAGVAAFREEHGNGMEIQVVVYNDEATQELLNEAFAS
jgi:O-acetyl-ADP-ribose deacetylase (regulator of RNase III)